MSTQGRPSRSARGAPREPSAGSIVFRAEETIERDARRVYEALVDLPRYTAWNPWLTRAEGEVRPGGVVWAHVVLRGRTMRVKHLVLVADAPHRLCWRDAGLSALVVYGQRTCTIAPLDSTGSAGAPAVRLRQELLLEGPLRAVAARRYGSSLESGLRAETQALKAYLERS
jgi:uncharacterized protein YndB with AHSA1/START domain